MSGHAFACFPFVLAMSFAWQSALAEEFSLMIGSPVAAQSFGSKTSVFVFRSKGCPEPAKLQVGGTAEGFVGSARRTVRLSFRPGSRASGPKREPKGSATGRSTTRFAA